MGPDQIHVDEEGWAMKLLRTIPGFKFPGDWLPMLEAEWYAKSNLSEDGTIEDNDLETSKLVITPDGASFKDWAENPGAD